MLVNINNEDLEIVKNKMKNEEDIISFNLSKEQSKSEEDSSPFFPIWERMVEDSLRERIEMRKNIDDFSVNIKKGFYEINREFYKMFHSFFTFYSFGEALSEKVFGVSKSIEDIEDFYSSQEYLKEKRSFVLLKKIESWEEDSWYTSLRMSNCAFNVSNSNDANFIFKIIVLD